MNRNLAIVLAYIIFFTYIFGDFNKMCLYAIKMLQKAKEKLLQLKKNRT
jgi:hypothetical protein